MALPAVQPESHDATWQFPVNDDGVVYGFVNAAAEHFRSDPMNHLVREAVQNAMDAKLEGLVQPVHVAFVESEVSTSAIGGDSLRPHVESCLALAKSEGQDEAIIAYTRGLEALEQATVNCLSIIDSGTTGLVDDRWNALVIQEGVVRKNQPNSGGSYGIGKNAVFNVSDLQTVMYSTRYIARRVGREERLQGKSRLIAHTAPWESDTQLQHMGFYRTQSKQPLRGRQIPVPFKLADTGTGVFVLGFNPHCGNWAKAAVDAVLENFFFALHHQQLVVEIQTNSEQQAIKLNHETADQHFVSSRRTPCYAYYRAIRDGSVRTVQAEHPLGPLHLYLLKGEGSRRTACLNHNGMLITDSRERKRNWLAPQNRNFWPDYAAVIAAATPQGDAWLRTMESPGHDAITPQQILDTEARNQAETVLNHARNALRETYDREFNTAQYEESSNLTELAYALPYRDKTAQGDRPLFAHVVKGKSLSAPHKAPLSETEGTQAPTILNQRIVSTGPNQLVIAFTVDRPGQIAIRLNPVGAERGSETSVQLIEALDLDYPETLINLGDGDIALVAETNRRMRLKVTAAQDIAHLAFTLS